METIEPENTAGGDGDSGEQGDDLVESHVQNSHFRNETAVTDSL